MKNLEKANKFMMEENHKAFYEEISQATTGYILKKYNIANSDSSISNVIKFLENNMLTNDVIDKYKEIQKKCEVARFAGMYDCNMGEMYHDALWLINRFEDK